MPLQEGGNPNSLIIVNINDGLYLVSQFLKSQAVLFQLSQACSWLLFFVNSNLVLYLSITFFPFPSTSGKDNFFLGQSHWWDVVPFLKITITVWCTDLNQGRRKNNLSVQFLKFRYILNKYA